MGHRTSVGLRPACLRSPCGPAPQRAFVPSVAAQQPSDGELKRPPLDQPLARVHGAPCPEPVTTHRDSSRVFVEMPVGQAKSEAKMRPDHGQVARSVQHAGIAINRWRASETAVLSYDVNVIARNSIGRFRRCRQAGAWRGLRRNRRLPASSSSTHRSASATGMRPPAYKPESTARHRHGGSRH